MAAAQKKVIVRLADGSLAWGYLPHRDFLLDGNVDLLGVDGRSHPIAFAAILWIAFVRDFNLTETADPERLGRRSFTGRPRGEGLWLRLVLRGGGGAEVLLEGLAPIDLGQIDSLVHDAGLFLTPPDLRSNTLQLFLPRHALESMEVLALITAPSRRLAAQKKTRAAADPQPGLFADPA